VPEPEGGAHRDPDYAAVLVLDAIVEALEELHDISPDRLVKERYRKFRRLGQTNTYIRELVAQEVVELSSLIGRTLGNLKERLPFGREEDTSEARAPVSGH